MIFRSIDVAANFPTSETFASAPPIENNTQLDSLSEVNQPFWLKLQEKKSFDKIENILYFKKCLKFFIFILAIILGMNFASRHLTWQ